MIRFLNHYHVSRMRQNKILVICDLHEIVLQKYAAQIDHKPYLAKANSDKWSQAIQQIQPKTIIINTEFFTGKMMQIWRSILPKEPLCVVRAGASLSRCDLLAAKLYSIHITNTPGVNSKYVADYMNQILFKSYSSSDRIAIIGVGNIGSLIAITAADYRVDFILFNKSKTSNRLSILDDEKIIFAQDLEEAIIQANKIAISLPLGVSTRGIITAKLIAKIPQNAILISVSPLEIFTNEALQALYHRKDIQVTFDDIQSELQRIYQILGSPDPLRNHFLMDTKAAASQECQNAMTSAAIEKGISLNPTKQDQDSPPCQIKSRL